ncbi:glycoside hydrolase family 18 protein [Caldimonas brevitalea]|uniref:chitinase n=1 Tax=Caldimonas brevitalea TaxID=413882 RepID=A0A0G3BJJ2_9BURK|nr:glycoside hydrolase family 18 protein [Caldimonas brevitalea]AKJ26715.1 chitinase [Caldimonas brevitalea]
MSSGWDDKPASAVRLTEGKQNRGVAGRPAAPQRRALMQHLAAGALLSVGLVACGGGGSSSSSGSGGPSSGDQAGSGTGSGGTGDSRPWVTAYYAGYFWEDGEGLQQPQHVDMTAMTHLVFARVAPGMGATVAQVVEGAGTAHDPNHPYNPGYVGAGHAGNKSVEQYLIDRAHAAGTQALLMVGGVGDGPAYAASTAPAVRATFVKNLLDYLAAHDYDGVDIDWEDDLDAPQHQAQLIALLKELRQRAKADYPRWRERPFVITFPGYALNTNTDRVDPWKVEVASLVDQYNLMSYAMAFDAPGWVSSHFSPIAGAKPNRPMDLTSSVQAYVDAGVPRHKVGIGIGFYAINIAPPVTGPDQAIPEGVHVESYDVEWSWSNLVRHGYLSEGQERWDTAAQMHYRSYPGGFQPEGRGLTGYLSYEDPDSIRAKGAWVRRTGAGGTIVWLVNYGSSDGKTNPLMDAVKEGFLAP